MLLRVTYEQVYKFALHIFNDDKDKTNAWWMNRSEELGNKSPFEFVKEGKGRYIIKLLEKKI